MTEKSIDNKIYWNKVYKEIGNVKPVYDLWLDKYKEILDKGRDVGIIDLGCGSGNDSIYLEERDYSVISCDYSKEALNIVSRHIKNSDLVEMDMTERLPFESDSAEVIIADLSLHYFDNMTTKSVLNEIKRVLKSRGYLIARVNSVNDINYNAGCGEEIERHFYLTKDGFKRFFDEDDIRKYFGVFNIQSMKETVMKRYGAEKRCFEVVCMNDKQ
ncbi:class I SAM-dependent methyltransferase [uncultured Clostridium sp.]|uniref:class I SAM-dependent methyltransferase n=1 Tax=uncultured Clostridium sp. TaxID=59620 RepID=UPI0025D48678|nr:class I SAM-dependent methyltransferase [uncultured Clostridium sp.]